MTITPCPVHDIGWEHRECTCKEETGTIFAYMNQLRAVIAAADRFILLRKTSHDGDEIHAALEDFYAVRAKLESEK